MLHVGGFVGEVRIYTIGREVGYEVAFGPTTKTRHWTIFPNEGWHLFEVVQDPTGATTIYVDGVKDSAKDLGLPNSGLYDIGNVGGETSAPVDVELIAVYPRAMTDGERQQFEATTDARWHLGLEK